MREDIDVGVVLVAREKTIDDMVTDCAEGNLSFSELQKYVAAMGYNTTSLYEMVVARMRK